MPNNFRKYPLKQEQHKDCQALLYKLKDFQSLEFLFPNLRNFKNFQGTKYEPCKYHYFIAHCLGNIHSRCIQTAVVYLVI